MQDRRGVDVIDRRHLMRPWGIPGQELTSRALGLNEVMRALFTHAGNGASPSFLAHAESRIVDAVLGMVPSIEIVEPLHRRAKIALALRMLLHESLETPIGVTEMCRAVGARERTLYLTCMEAFGRSPSRLLLELRLNAVRRALLHASRDDNVTSIALHYGFVHFGHFSAGYHRQFGELPSATLANARGQRPPRDLD